MRNGVIGWFKKREIEEDKKIEEKPLLIRK